MMMFLDGVLSAVTSHPSTVSEVWVSAPNARAQGSAVVTTEQVRFPVVGGRFRIECLPGKATLLLVHARETPLPQATMVEPVPLLVAEGMSQVASAVAAARSAGSHDVDELAAAAVRAQKLFEKLRELGGQVQGSVAAAERAVSDAGAAVARVRSEVAPLKVAAEQARDSAVSAKDRAVAAREAAEVAQSRAQQNETATRQAVDGVNRSVAGFVVHAGEARDEAVQAKQRAVEAAESAAAAAVEAVAASTQARARPAFFSQSGTAVPGAARVGDVVFDYVSGVVYQVVD